MYADNTTESMTYDEYLALDGFKAGRYPLVRENRLNRERQLAWSLSMPFEMDKGRVVDGPSGDYRARPRSFSWVAFVSDRSGAPPGFEGLCRLDKERLNSVWGVTTGASAVNTAWKLILEAGDPGYRVLLPYARDIVARPLEARIDRAGDLFDEMVRRISENLPDRDPVREVHRVLDPFITVNAPQVLPSVLPRDTAAWDIARALQLLRVSFRTGLIDVKDTDTLVDSALHVTRQAYGNWREYADGYIVGRAESAGLVDEDAFAERDAVADALNHPQSLWRTESLQGTAVR
ncbi:DUF1266 domain-containing protein [Corynebacterium sp. AOP40-9SA-29]|uniref:DUF1266 domain-containing protein n=1 Tax=Corynebacterium sp. AOP40-9SA-29 TaxID=3457677 RepID=UPI004034D6CF